MSTKKSTSEEPMSEKSRFEKAISKKARYEKAMSYLVLTNKIKCGLCVPRKFNTHKEITGEDNSTNTLTYHHSTLTLMT